MLALSALLLLVSGSWSPAEAIVNGTLTAPSPQNHATVVIGNPGFCTGTLIAPNLVLTALHCPVGRPTASAMPHPPFRSAYDWERPDRFYRLTAPLQIQIGTQTPGLLATAIEYAVPGLTDIVLLRLRQPVSAATAQPARLMTALSHLSDPAGWLAGLTFQVAGFGDVNDADNVDLDGDGFLDGTFSGVLRQGTANRAVLGCPRSGGWAYPATYFICVESGDGSGTRQGDSGGPLYWTDSAGLRYLVGTYQGMERANGGRYIASFYRGGANYDSLPYPNLGDWLEPMVYGREGGTAFLFSADPTPPTPEWEYVSRTYAANPSGRFPHVIRLDPPTSLVGSGGAGLMQGKPRRQDGNESRQ